MCPVDNNEIKVVVMTPEELQERDERFIEKLRERDENFISDTVESTLVKIGWNVTSWASGRVYRTEILRAIPRREFDKAVREGHLKTRKNDESKRNSRVYVLREDWERYRKWRNNRKF